MGLLDLRFSREGLADFSGRSNQVYILSTQRLILKMVVKIATLALTVTLDQLFRLRGCNERTLGTCLDPG